MELSTRKRVYDYFKAHPQSTAVQCTLTLNLDGVAVMHEINALWKCGCLSSMPVPLGKGADPHNSNYYFVCGAYKEK